MTRLRELLEPILEHRQWRFERLALDRADVAGGADSVFDPKRALNLPTHRRGGLKPRVDRFAFQSQHAEYAFVHAIKRLAFHEAVQCLVT
jgi:hypothetical protein